jgi:ribosome-associated translation inhibitor RaiA
MPADAMVLSEIIDGPVAAMDRVYAFDRIRELCRTAARAVNRARTRLTVPPHPIGDRPAAAEATLVLDGGVLVCAGATAATMRDAIDLLMARLRKRLPRVIETPRHQPIGSLPVSAA